MTPDALFALICYHVLTSPVEGKSPDYLHEKSSMLAMSGFSAFTFLDARNQARCISYCERWHVPIPDEVQSYWQDTQNAVKALFERGIDLP